MFGKNSRILGYTPLHLLAIFVFAGESLLCVYLFSNGYFYQQCIAVGVLSYALKSLQRKQETDLPGDIVLVLIALFCTVGMVENPLLNGGLIYLCIGFVTMFAHMLMQSDQRALS